MSSLQEDAPALLEPGIGRSEANDLVAAFRRMEPEISAVAARDMLPIRVHVARVVLTVLEVLPKLQALRPDIEKVGGFDLVRFDKLRDLALALAYAHAARQAVPTREDAVPVLALEVTQLRDMLFADAMALARRKLLDLAAVSRLRSGPGYQHLATQVLRLVALIRKDWERIEGRSALTLAELDHASSRADELTRAINLRGRPTNALTTAAETRQRAFTLFMNAYEDARRVVTYLRWHEGDADEIAPSFSPPPKRARIGARRGPVVGRSQR